MQPTIGRIVYVRVGGEDGIRPAFITKVWSDECVNLHVIRDNGDGDNVSEYITSSMYNESENLIGSWYWPPIPKPAVDLADLERRVSELEKRVDTVEKDVEAIPIVDTSHLSARVDALEQAEPATPKAEHDRLAERVDALEQGEPERQSEPQRGLQEDPHRRAGYEMIKNA